MRFISIRSIALLALVVILGGFAYHRYALHRFEEAYRAYESIATLHDEAAVIPMLPDNPLRRDLNQALVIVLSDEASPEDRIAKAREGLALLTLAEGNIDALGDVGADATAALLGLESAINPIALGAYTVEKALVELAHRRLSAIADIRGLSYRANHDTKTIFDRIIADGGSLTEAHGADLERLLPDVEEQFNRRSNLLVEVESLAADIREAFDDVESTW